MGKLLIVLVGIPLIETWFLIKMGGVIGALPTIALVIFTAVVGGILVRQQGFSTINRLQQKMQSGQMPAEELFAGMLIIIAGVLLITPGFFTDAMGFLCLFPPFRHWFAGAIIRSGAIKMANPTMTGSGFGGTGSPFGSMGQNGPSGHSSGTAAGREQSNGSRSNGTVIDAEYEVRDD